MGKGQEVFYSLYYTKHLLNGKIVKRSESKHLEIKTQMLQYSITFDKILAMIELKTVTANKFNVAEMIVSDRKHCEERIKYWLLAFKSSVFLGLLKLKIA